MRLDELVEVEVRRQLSTLSALSQDEYWDRLRPLLAARLPAGALGSADEKERGFALIQDILRSSGDFGREVWMVLSEPEVQSRTQQLASICVLLLGGSFPEFRTWEFDRIVTLMLFVASMAQSHREK